MAAILKQGFIIIIAGVPVNRLLVGIFSAQLGVPVLGRVLVVVAELRLRQEGAELLGLLRAHAQMTAVQILFNVHEEQVPERERARETEIEV